MKKLIVTVMCIMLIWASIPFHASAEQNGTVVQVNGEAVGYGAPSSDGDQVMIPLRAVFEKLGASVAWNGTANRAEAYLGSEYVSFGIDDRNAGIDGRNVEMPVPARLVDSITMIPAVFLSENLGMGVEWDRGAGVVNIDTGSVNITDIQLFSEETNFRIVISSDGEIGDYTAFTLDNPSRMAVDIKNAVLKFPAAELEAKSNYVYRVRSAQNSLNPNIVRVVADLTAWTGYKVTLSGDKKQLYIDFSNTPEKLENVSFTRTDSAENINIDMKYPRKPVITALRDAGKLAVDIPMASVGALEKNIAANGKYVKSVELSQLDYSTARLTISTAEAGFMNVTERDGGITLSFSNALGSGISYSNTGTPTLTIRNEKLSFNYFNYKETVDGVKYTLSLPAYALDAAPGTMFINDRYINSIDILKSQATADIVINAKEVLKYSVNTIDDSQELVVSAYPQGTPDRGDDRTIPDNVKNKIVVIDPGHGGSEVGAIYPIDAATAADVQVKEKDLNLDISLKLYDMLKKAGVNVYMTRQDDRDMSVYERADFANNLNASLFLSVHSNSGTSGESGTMSLFYPSVYNPSYGISGERFAQITQEELLAKLGTNNMGVWKRPRLVVLNSTRMPSALAEVAYTSDQSDREKLLTEEFRTRAAEALCNSVIRALKEISSTIGNPNPSQPPDGTVQPSEPGTVLPEDLQPRNINGFAVPAKASSKCTYSGIGSGGTSYFDLSVQLDVAKEKSGTATLAQQVDEARQVLLTKLDSATVDKIMNYAVLLKSGESFFWDDTIENDSYTIWVRCLHNTGTASIDIKHK